MEEQADAKLGRPRRYDLEPLPDFASPEVGLAAAALDELRERVIDQIAHLPEEALASVPEGLTFSIASLVVHMVWAEAGWVRRMTGDSESLELRNKIEPAGRAVPAGERVSAGMDAEALTALCRQVRDEFTVPALSDIDEIDADIDDPRGATVRGVLMHLIWHWTYHSGQVGLLAELWGADYAWTFGPLG